MLKFQKTFCSQCSGVFGPGDSGFSHCEDHTQTSIKTSHTRLRIAPVSA